MTPIERQEFDMEWRRHFTWPMPMAKAIKEAEKIVRVTMPEKEKQQLIKKGDALLKSDNFENFMTKIRSYLAEGKSNLNALTQACLDYELKW